MAIANAVREPSAIVGPGSPTRVGDGHQTPAFELGRHSRSFAADQIDDDSFTDQIGTTVYTKRRRTPRHPDHPWDYGSRKLSLITRVTGFKMYSSTDLRPILMFATIRMPGRRPKSGGRLRNFVSAKSTCAR